MATIPRNVRDAADKAGAMVNDASDNAAEAMTDAVDDLDEAEAGLADRLAALREELGNIAGQLEEFAADRLDDVLDLASAAGHQGARAVRTVGRRASAVGSAVREDPLPVVVGLGVIALLTALFIGRSSQR